MSTTNSHSKKVLAASVVAAAGILYGFDMGTMHMIFYLNSFRVGVGLSTMDSLTLNENGIPYNETIAYGTSTYNKVIDNPNMVSMVGVFFDIYFVGALIGCILSYLLDDLYGRKKNIDIKCIYFFFWKFNIGYFEWRGWNRNKYVYRGSIYCWYFDCYH